MSKFPSIVGCISGKTKLAHVYVYKSTQSSSFQAFFYRSLCIRKNAGCSHIHVLSVQPLKCFPSNTVITSYGKTYLDELVEGDQALSYDDNGNIFFSEVWCITHHVKNSKATYLQIDTESKRLVISHRHFILVKNGEKPQYKKAEDIQQGDIVFVLKIEGGKKIRIEEPVKHVEEVEEEGIYNVFTKSGRIIANGIFCSTYAEVHPNLVHPFLAPLRAAYDVTPTVVMNKIMTSNEEGKPYLFKAGGGLLKPVVNLFQ